MSVIMTDTAVQPTPLPPVAPSLSELEAEHAAGVAAYNRSEIPENDPAHCSRQDEIEEQIISTPASSVKDVLAKVRHAHYRAETATGHESWVMEAMDAALEAAQAMTPPKADAMEDIDLIHALAKYHVLRFEWDQRGEHEPERCEDWWQHYSDACCALEAQIVAAPIRSQAGLMAKLDFLFYGLERDMNDTDEQVVELIDQFMSDTAPVVFDAADWLARADRAGVEVCFVMGWAKQDGEATPTSGVSFMYRDDGDPAAVGQLQEELRADPRFTTLLCDRLIHVERYAYQPLAESMVAPRPEPDQPPVGDVDPALATA